MRFDDDGRSVRLVDQAGNVLWDATHDGSQVYHVDKDGIEYAYDPATQSGSVKREMVDVDDGVTITKRPASHVHPDLANASQYWAMDPVRQRRLPEAGLRESENVLVCERVDGAYPEEDRGDVIARCRDCKEEVWVLRRWVTLWGKKDCGPPAVVCRECYGDQHSPNFSLDTFQVQDSVTFDVTLEQYKKIMGQMKDSWSHWEVSSRDYARKVLDLSTTMEEASKKISTCVRCGQEIRDNSGRKTCQGCQRKQWRRS